MPNIRKTTAQLRAAGSRRVGERNGEPQPEPGVPDYCTDMTDAAKTVWFEMVGVLGGMDVLTKADGKALSRYCQLLARYWECERVIAERGMVQSEPVVSKAGEIVGYIEKERQECKIASALLPQLQRLECDFGLNPAARSRLTTIKHRADDASSKSKARFFGETG